MQDVKSQERLALGPVILLGLVQRTENKIVTQLIDFAGVQLDELEDRLPCVDDGRLHLACNAKQLTSALSCCVRKVLCNAAVRVQNRWLLAMCAAQVIESSC